MCIRDRYSPKRDTPSRQQNPRRDYQDEANEGPPIRKSNLMDDKRRLIDEEIERRIREEQDKRRRFIGVGESRDEAEGEFKHTPYSTEMSRRREMTGRLQLEKRARDEKINKLAENQLKPRP
eukprot:TRINITY_DN0_c7627_g1_i1.p1 TRINITY_DN0_c7627_g1~~TRINITY_DN0_c7627_g1_i1.p1  ORF type:complete len:122 (+),score=29.54 TRINITY_DN0_c7627_g1_i1:1-366(+)